MPDDEILDLAPLVGLDAVHGSELDDIHRDVDAAGPGIRAEFDRQVTATREAMANLSGATASAPPNTLRERVLAAAHVEFTVERTESARGAPAPVVPATPDPAASEPTLVTVTPLRRRRRVAYLAAAAVAAIAIGAVGWVIGASSNPEPSLPPTAEQVFAAKDVRTSSGDVATGHATVTYSPSANAGVLVMNDVPPPEAGTVYQMWLVGPDGSTSAGTMSDKDVAPSTTAVLKNLGAATTLAFTVEPPGGSPRPTGPFVAELPLS